MAAMVAIGMILAIFYLHHPDASYQVSSQWPFGSGDEAKNIFQDGRCSGHFGFPIGPILPIFDLQVTECFLPSFKSIGLLVQENDREIDFQDGRHGNHPGFPNGTILAVFDLQVMPMLPTKFPVNWHFVSGIEAKKCIFKIGAILDF